MAANNGRSRAEDIAEAIGVVIGAASTCDGISQDRLQSTLDKAKDLVMAAAENDADAAAATDCFSTGFDIGHAAVEDGRIDPQQVETALNDLERELSR